MRNYLLKICTYFFSCFLLSLCPQKTFATHSMGADLTYRCLGGNNYEITFAFYRDCSGVSADDSAMISLSSSCFGDDTIYLQRIPGTGQEITPICPSEETTCGNGTYTGIQEYVYKGIVTLQGPCADWTFSYNLCCRNWAITNINQPGNTMMYVYATLNNTVTPCNNSPTFSNKPVPFVCLGQQYCFNHGAYDVDGDSLVYSPITPFDSPGWPINYNVPFSATNPLSSNPALTFNTMNGDICMTPSALEVTVMAVLVQEYRNGVLIGSVERDIQVTVLNCNNQLPALTGINGSNNFSLSICAGAPTCFTINSSDADANQNTFVSWDHSIPGASFTVNPGPRQSATFCWTPTVADISVNPYCFTATVHDDNCPYMGSQVYSYCITVNGVMVDAGPDQAVGCNSYATLTASASLGTGNYSYQWNNGATSSSITSGSGTYVVTVSDGMCTNKDTVKILGGATAPTVNFSPVNGCAGTAVQFTDLTTISGDIIASWYWDFGDGGTSTAQHPLHNFPATGAYSILLVVQSAGGCIDSLIRMLNITNDQPTASFSFNDVCLGALVHFTDLSVSPAAVTNRSWSFGDVSTSIVQNPDHLYLTPGNYPVSFIMTNTSGCTDSVTQTVIVHPLPVADAGNGRSICEGSSSTLSATGGISYLWMPDSMSSPSVTVTPASTQTYVVMVTDANNCSASDNITVTVNPNPVADAGPDQTICSGSPATLTATGGGSYLWNPDSGATQQIIVSPAISTMYTVMVTNSYGCQAFAQVTVSVNARPVAYAGADQSICSGTHVILHASGAGTYQWQPGGDTTQAVERAPVGTVIYLLTVTNAAGCTDTDHVSVIVNPLPVAAFGSPAVVCQGAVVQFSDQSYISSGTISSWSWSFGNNSSSIMQSPAILYADTGSYPVSLVVTSNAGCSDTGTSVVVMAPVPDVSLSSVDVCLRDAVNFVNGTTIVSGETLNYQWNFGDGTFASQPEPIHNYLSYGDYNTSLIATSGRGCSDTAFREVHVHPLPVPGFSNYPVCQRSSVQFSDSSFIPADAISLRSWNFGDSTESSIVNPTHHYSSAGLYWVKLILVSDFGCRDSVMHLQRIHPNPVPAFIAENKCLGDSIRFNNLSTIAGGSITMWQWDMGDHTLDYSYAPVHLYQHPQSYNVKLSLVSDNGCISVLIIPSAAVVYPIPQAAFVPNATEVEEIFPFVHFDNQSTVDFSSVWDFGDGTSSTDFSPDHLYHQPGIFDVQLYMTDQNGCRDTAYSRIEVKRVASIFIPNAFTPNGDGVNDTFHASFVNQVSVVTQIFDRWGKKIAEWSDLNGSWDGMYEGQPVQADVYVYRLESVDIDGKKEVRTGHVTIIR